MCELELGLMFRKMCTTKCPPQQVHIFQKKICQYGCVENRADRCWIFRWCTHAFLNDPPNMVTNTSQTLDEGFACPPHLLTVCTIRSQRRSAVTTWRMHAQGLTEMAFGLIKARFQSQKHLHVTPSKGLWHHDCMCRAP